MNEYKVRAHHGMCLAFFEGKGYSSEFTDHMTEMKEKLAADPGICIITDTDDICSACPNNHKGSCTTAAKAAGYDRQVLSYCHLEEGAELTWKEFDKLVLENILKTGKRKEICGDCQWDAICSRAFQEKF